MSGLSCATARQSFFDPLETEKAPILMKLRMFLSSEPVSTSREHALDAI